MTDNASHLREQLSAYLDGELTPAEVEAIEAVLAADAELAAELERIRRTRQLVRGLPRAAAPDDLADRVLAQAERQRLVAGRPTAPRAAASMRWLRYAAAAAVLLVAAGVGFVIVLTWQATRNAGDLATAPQTRPAVDEYGLATEDGDGRRADKDGGWGGRELAKGGDTGGARMRRREPAGKASGSTPVVAERTSPGAPVPATPSPVRDAKQAEWSEVAPGGPEYALALSLGNATNVDIDVPDLPGNRRLAREQIRDFLVSNGIEPLMVTNGRAQPAAKHRARANVYFQESDLGREQYVAFVPREQVAEFQSQLALVQRSQLALQDAARLVQRRLAEQQTVAQRKPAGVVGTAIANEQPTLGPTAGRSDEREALAMKSGPSAPAPAGEPVPTEDEPAPPAAADVPAVPRPAQPARPRPEPEAVPEGGEAMRGAATGHKDAAGTLAEADTDAELERPARWAEEALPQSRPGEPAPTEGLAAAEEKLEDRALDKSLAKRAEAAEPTAGGEEADALTRRTRLSDGQLAQGVQQRLGGVAGGQLGASGAQAPVQEELARVPKRQVELARRVLDAKQANEEAEILGADVRPLVITLNFVSPGPVPEPAANALFETYRASLDKIDGVEVLRDQLRLEAERQAGEAPNASAPTHPEPTTRTQD